MANSRTATARTVRARTEPNDFEGDGYATVEAELDVRPSHLYDEADENLERALRNLEARVGQLFERLDPVMTPYDNGDKDRIDAEPARSSQGRLINRLQDVADRLDGFSATLYTIHRRLVLPGDVD